MTKNKELELLETPKELSRALFRNVLGLSWGDHLEPCNGHSAISDLLPSFTTNDIDENKPADFHYDASVSDGLWQYAPRFNWVITNPPFSLAHKILPLAYENSYSGVAFLLRLTYLEPCGNRADWLKKHADKMSHLIVFNPRPKFKANKKGKLATDSATVAWMVWQRDWTKGTNVVFVDSWNA